MTLAYNCLVLNAAVVWLVAGCAVAIEVVAELETSGLSYVWRAEDLCLLLVTAIQFFLSCLLLYYSPVDPFRGMTVRHFCMRGWHRQSLVRFEQAMSAFSLSSLCLLGFLCVRWAQYAGGHDACACEPAPCPRRGAVSAEACFVRHVAVTVMWLTNFAVLLTAEASLDDFTLQAPPRNSAQFGAIPRHSLTPHRPLTARARRRQPARRHRRAALRLLRRPLGRRLRSRRRGAAVAAAPV